MVAVDVIFMTGLFSILICILIVLSCLRYIKYVDKEDSEVKLRTKFKGICNNPEFAAAITRGLTSQTTNTTAVLMAGEREEEDTFETSTSCTTCSLIAEGSSMAYSDDTCPQCGADTLHLTDPLKLIY